MDKYKFGEFIYLKRKKLGLTQEELGRKLDVTNKAVSKWETGETLPEVSLLEPLANALNVSIDELLTQKESKVKEIIVKKKNYLLIITTIVLLIICLTLSILLVNTKNSSKRKENITLENFDKYYLITPCNSFEVDGYKLTINGSIKNLYEILDPILVISFNVHYYYENSTGGKSELLYYDREISYNQENDFSLELSPKNEISNFKDFISFAIDYEVKEVSGYITL